MDSKQDQNIQSSHPFDLLSALKSIFSDHVLKYGFNKSSKKNKAGEVDFSDFESVGGTKDRKLFD